MADPTRTARASPSNGKARGKVPGRGAGVRASSGSASRLLLAGDRWLRHRHGIGRRKGVFERLLQGSFLLAFLGAIARLALLFTVGRGRLGWHGFTSTSRPARAPSRPGRCRAIGENRVGARKLAQHVFEQRGERRRSGGQGDISRTLCQDQWITSTTVRERGSTIST